MDGFVGLWVLALGLAGYGVIAHRSGDALHPLAVFWAAWLGVFAFAHFNVPRAFDEPYYAEPFGAVAYLAVFAGLLSFTAGFFLARPGLVRPTPTERDAWEERLEATLDPRRLGLVTLALFGVAAATTVWFVARLGEVPLFSPRINELRLEFKLPLWGYLYDLHYAVALFAAMLAAWSRRGVRLAWSALAISSTLLLMAGAVRVSPLTALAWVVIFLTYRPGRLRVRRIVFAAVAVLLVFGVIEQYRRSTIRLDPTLANPRLDLSPQATAWAHSAASFKNLQFTLERPSPLYMGITSYDLPKTLHPPAREIDREFSYLFGTHNTPTFLSFLYFDFGWGGLLLIPALYGAVVAYVYDRFRQRPSVFWIIVHIDFLLATALAFRTHRFFGNSLIFFAAVALLVQVLAAPARRGVPAERGAWEPSPI